ncbi:protocadherin-20 [Callorhinchus milii]|uniref:protocadherin-20 n=1 Tax=Callorhinchus milii TaxID=7868 RepID=UPI001C3F71D1|nr:protocadherin-20 [Callorhinchus milii]
MGWSLLFLGLLSGFAGCGLAFDLVYRVKEGLPRARLIGNIRADLKMEQEGDARITYNLQPEAVRFVELERASGQLLTSDTALDRESLCAQPSPGQPCALLLDVIILPQRYFRLVKVQVIVEDINDNPPRFPLDQLSLSIPENSELGARFPVEPSAEDADVGANGLQSYRLLGSQGRFSLSTERAEDGRLVPWLVVRAALDRELEDVYGMSLVAEDGGSPRLSGSVSLTVTITDINDNCPEFTRTHLDVTVLANTTVGTSLAQLHTTDPDLGHNAHTEYSYSDRVSLTSRKLFRLDKMSGVITLAAPIQRDTAPAHRLTVLATGSGCIPVIAFVQLRVVRLGSSPPVVTPRYIALQSDGVVYLKETEPAPTPIAFFTVTDPEEEEEEKQEVRCYLEGEGPFRLVPYLTFKDEYLLETSQPLDYELKRGYELAVVAENTKGLTLRTRLTVQLIDQNDNSPAFTNSLVDVSIEENNPPDTFLIQLKATDDDSGKMGAIAYTLEPGSPPCFALDQVTGVLAVSASLDREVREKYRLMVRATDGGSPARESTATVLVTVLDKNDNKPRFINKDFSFFVPENFPSFGEIGVVGVTDPDAGSNGWLALSVLNGSEHFVIDTGKGNLMAKVPLDREQQSSYVLWVQAIDGGKPALSAVAQVTILLLDVNDNPPVVLFPQSNLSFLLVLPSTAPGSSITEVYAVDKDTGMNAVIAYTIIGRRGPRPESFGIDTSTGNITLQESLVKSDCGLYRLLVKVSDHGYPEPLHSTVIVNLFVNETLSNESYIENLLRKDTNIRIEESVPETRVDPFQTKLDQFPCQGVLIALSATCFGLLTVMFSLMCCLFLKKRKHKSNDYNVAEVEIPLNKSIASHSLEKKPMNDSDL